MCPTVKLFAWGEKTDEFVGNSDALAIIYNRITTIMARASETCTYSALSLYYFWMAFRDLQRAVYRRSLWLLTVASAVRERWGYIKFIMCPGTHTLDMKLIAVCDWFSDDSPPSERGALSQQSSRSASLYACCHLYFSYPWREISSNISTKLDTLYISGSSCAGYDIQILDFYRRVHARQIHFGTWYEFN